MSKNPSTNTKEPKLTEELHSGDRKSNTSSCCLWILLLILFLWLILGLILFSRNRSTTYSRTIRVQGNATEQVSPEWAVLRLGVTTESTSAQQAAMQANARMSQIINSLQTIDLGIEAKDIRTSEYSISPKYSYPTPTPTPADQTPNIPRIVAYTATQEITVLIRSLEKVGLVLDRAIGLGNQQSLGANIVSGLTFQISPSKQEEIMIDLRKNAIEQAYRIATQEAQAAGVKVGNVINIEETGMRAYPEPVYYNLVQQRAHESAQIQPGTQTISSTVSVTYAIV